MGPTGNTFSSFILDNLESISTLRKEIHAHPELSNEETKTADTLITFLKKLSNPPEIVPVGGTTGFLAIFNFGTEQMMDEASSRNIKTVVFRCELDAVPVEEKNDFGHCSTNCGVSHKCGHDGHMAILAGLALLLSDHYRPESGKVVLLFQPAEETGTGAQLMIDTDNKVLSDIIASPNTSIFALHNVPGFPEGSVVLPRGSSFAAASKGMHVKLTGATSHASQPSLGRNPALAMCNVIQALLAMPSLYIPWDCKALVTLVGARAGEKAFGVSAGDAEVMVTMRATTDKTLAILEEKSEMLVKGLAATYGLTYSITFEDAFAATVNDLDSVSLVQNVATENGLGVFWMEESFPWSEDFGVFLKHTKGAMFGLGVGEKHEQLHGEYYDFPDKQIPNGVNMFASVLKRLLEM